MNAAQKALTFRLVGVRPDGDHVTIASGITLEAATNAMDRHAGVGAFDRKIIEVEFQGQSLCDSTQPVGPPDMPRIVADSA
jgi:hypothetical protein